LSDVLLSETDQAALRFVLASDPLPGRSLPPSSLLERLAELVRCDAIGAVVTDPDGYVIAHVELPPGPAGHLSADGLSDSVGLGFRNGRGQVVQLWWDRRTGEFSPRDVALLRMIAPVVQRLVRDAVALTLPESLTVQERRTLVLVAAGLPNREIARRMGVATCTVRKHLEHAYRKLGVTNRLAAAVAVRGQLLAPADLAR
jgi:DNA-binding CsgD family transcriptional regulator